MKLKNFNNLLQEVILLKKKLFILEPQIEKSIKIIFKTLKEKKKIWICGNGGSAADAQHLSAEFLVRLRPKINRKPYPIVSLALDTSTITACGNDYTYDLLFSRNLEALASKGDLLICLSTSGNSNNIINVLKKARSLKIKSLSFLGNKGGLAKKYSDLNIIVPNDNTARIQESHILIGHYILEKVENLLLGLKIK
jgi:D-sedoheptulose 7-phosphate isomerase